VNVHVFDLQEVVVNSYVSDSCTAVQCQHCSASCSNTSAVVCLYDSTDKFNKHLQGFLRQTKHSYSVIIIAVIVKSTSDSFCTFMDSVKQLANVLPDDIIANGVIINVGRNLCKFWRFMVDVSAFFVDRIVRSK